MQTVCHFTSVHQRYDPRIFLKQCSSLTQKFDTYLIVADGLGNEVKNGVNIIDVGTNSGSKIARFARTTFKVYVAARNLGASIYEFHDPELLFYGLLLKSKNVRVIFDMHEDTSSQIMVREWIPRPLKRLLVLCYSFVEKQILKRLDTIFVPQEFMKIKFQNINKTVLISNYLLSSFYPDLQPKTKVDQLLYVGSISLPRGIMNMLNALEKVNTRLTLVGPFSDSNLEQAARNHPSWHKVDYLGILNHDEVKKVYLGNYIGLIPFCNEGQYGHPYVIKLFEYMSFGLPIIMPNFGGWGSFNDKYMVGVNTNTESTVEFANTITGLLNQDISKYSINGRKHVKAEFLWDQVEATLLNSYNEPL